MPILFENTEVMVVYKPTGLIVHADAKTNELSLSDWFIDRVPTAKSVGEAQRVASGEIVERSGIVHRLDRETSGVIILAKTQESFENLKEQFKEHTISKIYNAFVYGHFKEDTGIIDRPIGRSSQDFRMWSAQRGARGELREAVTEYKVLKQGIDKEYKEPVSYMELHPKTGRTHQLRVHMKAINHQIVADTLYAPKRPHILGFSRLALHARQISFKLLDGSLQTIEACLPEDFETALTKI